MLCSSFVTRGHSFIGCWDKHENTLHRLKLKISQKSVSGYQVGGAINSWDKMIPKKWTFCPNTICDIVSVRLRCAVFSVGARETTKSMRPDVVTIKPRPHILSGVNQFWRGGPLPGVIIPAKFQLDRFRGFRAPRLWKSPLTWGIALTTVLCTIVLHCDFFEDVFCFRIMSVSCSAYGATAAVVTGQCAELRGCNWILTL